MADCPPGCPSITRLGQILSQKPCPLPGFTFLSLKHTVPRLPVATRQAFVFSCHWDFLTSSSHKGLLWVWLSLIYCLYSPPSVGGSLESLILQKGQWVPVSLLVSTVLHLGGWLQGKQSLEPWPTLVNSVFIFWTALYKVHIITTL